MAPRKSREVKSAAPSPSPAPSGGRTRTTRSRSSKAPSEASVVETETENEDVPESTEDEDANEDSTEDDGQGNGVENGVEDGLQDKEVEPEVGEKEEVEQGGNKKVSMEDRLAKMKELRMRMNQTSQQNRKDLISDHQKSKVTAKEMVRLEKQKKLAQTLRLKAEADENGEDLERKKNWEYTIEDNERWEKKLEEQKVKLDTDFHNAEDDAHKRYNRNIRSTKVDLAAYERQKEIALGLAPGTLVFTGGSSNAVAGSSRAGALTASEDLYRGADTLAYGDHKPSEDALDRVAEKINKDIGKYGKRKNKKDDEDDEVTYINERNKVFNKKVARYFDKYTKEIRANFERGTAL